MPPFVDLTGQTFGRLRVLGRAPNRGRRTVWRCLCYCGKETVVGAEHLKSGNTGSCGCLHREWLKEGQATHGHSRRNSFTREYKAWSHAKQRCTNPNDKKYKFYGGRGIQMCPRWMDSFRAFIEDMGPCPDGLTIDRVDPNGDYEPGNCRWVPMSVQHVNNRDTIRYEFGGKLTPLPVIARELGIKYMRLYQQMRIRGRTLDEAVRQIAAMDAID